MNRRAATSILHVGDVRAEVTYKNIKNLRMRVVPPDATVKVSVPLGVAQERVAEFIRSQEEWVREARVRVQRANPPSHPLVDGGYALLWGSRLPVTLEDGPRAGGRLAGDVVVLTGSDDDARRRGLESLYRRELRQEVLRLFELWQPRVGRSHGSLKLRRMTSRWGTCNTRTGAITINTALAERHPSALEYVVVHELMHLIEAGHGPRFARGMDELLPQWRERRLALRGPA